MVLKKWDELPGFMRVPEVKPYYEKLVDKKTSLMLKRIFDVVVAVLLLMVMALPMAILAIAIKIDSEGPVFYRQVRVTSYGKTFRIHKFRTMVSNADKIGSAVTVSNDCRVTRMGKLLRKVRLDELPQLVDVLRGDMSFVGTRPEVLKYVERYKPEYYATLLLPAGITSEASILYKDEERLLNSADDVDKVYIEDVLPGKMAFNLKSIKSYSFWGDIKIMLRTVFAVCGKGNSQ